MPYDERIELGECTDGRVELVRPPPCPDGTYGLEPLWVQRLQDDGTYSEPAPVPDSTRSCVTASDLAAQARTAFTSMTVPTPTASLQPDHDVLLVNMYHPVYTDADVVTQVSTLLDVPVEIRAVPTEFTWDFDDPFSPQGGTLTTTDPGRPWAPGDDLPDERWVAHAWTQLGDPETASGYDAGARYDEARSATFRTDVTVTLTTTWHGQFRIAGTTAWTDIDGTLTTTSTVGTFTVTEARSQLVCSDTYGNGDC